MKRPHLLKIMAFLVIFGSVMPAFSEDTSPSPYRENEFPQFLKDARRFEIITLGALPFVSLQTALGYSCYQYAKHDFESAYFPNPFAASSYSQEEQIGLLFTSLGICVGIGITDLIIQLVKRGKLKKTAFVQDSNLIITPVSQAESLGPVRPFLKSEGDEPDTSPDGFFSSEAESDSDFLEDGVELINQEVLEAD